MLFFLKSVFRPDTRVKRLKNLRTKVQSESQYLAGRNSLSKDLIRLFRIALEFIRGMRTLHPIGPAVSVFGSAQFGEGHPYYELGRKVGSALAREGYTVMTGGGPGIMEAANRGAQEIGGISVGCNIILPHEQGPNPYVDLVVTFYYFFVRKIMLTKYSYAFVILPGGMGTLDEMSEAITLIKTGKLYEFPVILMGKEYWKGFFDWVNEVLIKSGAVSHEELNFVHLTDDPLEAIRMINESVMGLELSLTPLSSTCD